MFADTRLLGRSCPTKQGGPRTQQHPNPHRGAVKNMNRDYDKKPQKSIGSYSYRPSLHQGNPGQQSNTGLVIELADKTMMPLQTGPRYPRPPHPCCCKSSRITISQLDAVHPAFPTKHCAGLQNTRTPQVPKKDPAVLPEMGSPAHGRYDFK